MSGEGPSTSKTSGTYNLSQPPLRFYSAHTNIEISPDKYTAKLVKGSSGAAFSDRPVRVNEKICLRQLDIDDMGVFGPCICVGFIGYDPAVLDELSDYIPNRKDTGHWIKWLESQYCDKDKLLYYYVNGKGELRFGINGEEQGVIMSNVNTSGPLWAAIQLFGSLREVQLVDPETLDGVKRPDQHQVKDGVRHPDQSQVEVGIRHPDHSQVKDGVRHHDQSQVEDGVRRRDQSQVKDGVTHPDHSQVENRVRRSDQSQVKDGVRRLDQSQVKDGVRRPDHGQVESNANHNFAPSTSKTSRTNNLPPLRFHSAHSKNIEISSDKSTARLKEGYNSGAAFSDRPVRVNEKVSLRFVDIKYRYTSGLSPDISFGFTCVNPATLAQSVPDILSTMNYGYWITWLHCEYYENIKSFHFYRNRKGELRYGINGEDEGAIMSAVKTSGPLWAVIQLFGGLREVQLADPETLNGVRCPDHSQVKDGVRHPDQSQVKDGVRRRDQSQVKNGVRRRDQSQVKEGVRRPNHSQVESDPLVNRIRSLSVEPLPISRYQNLLGPLTLHKTKGRNIKPFHSDRGIVARLEGIPSKSYVFSAQPMLSGQTIVVQIFAIEKTNQGSLNVGLTSCDPATLTSHELPDDVGLLQDRPEYWVVYPDAANGLHIGDELGVTLTRDGKMEISRNSSKPVAVFHVDHTINLWAFIDISGTTQMVKILISKGAVEPSQQNKKKTRKRQKRKDKVSSQLNREVLEKAVLPMTSKPECTICLEDQVDSVIYKCGHMCMCYDCAMKQWKGEGSASGKCPLCRSIITDVIRTYTG